MGNLPAIENPRVFISYAHEPKTGHRAVALEVAQTLRSEGIVTQIDQYIEHDPPLWPMWTANEIRDSDFVICLVSPLYKSRAEGIKEDNAGRGVTWEGAVITEQIYSDLHAESGKFIPVILPGFSLEDTPQMLFPTSHSWYSWPGDYEQLYRRLTRQPAVIPREVGPVRILEADY